MITLVQLRFNHFHRNSIKAPTAERRLFGQNMNRLLFIAYSYPPGGYVGQQRVLKFRKFLPDFGFETAVLCGRPFGALPDDGELSVFRAGEPTTLFRPVLRRFVQSIDKRPPNPQRLTEGSRLEGVRNWIVKWLLIPDLQLFWIPFAVAKGLRVIRRQKIDFILSTSGPESNHLVGAILSKLTKIPLIADFRDGWLFEPLKPGLRESEARRRIEGQLESFVISQADAITTVSEPLTEYFRRTYRLSDRAETIANGYDCDDWALLEPIVRRDGKCRLLHTGAFGRSISTRDPEPLFQALAALPAETQEELELLLVGNVSEREKSLIAEHRLSHVVRILPPVPREESLRHQLAADVLVLLAGEERSMATSKLYEYLYARRPILAIGHPETAGCRIVAECEAGVIADIRSPDAIREKLQFFFDAWKCGELRLANCDIAQYDRRRLTERLAALLCAVTARRATAHTARKSRSLRSKKGAE